MTASERTPLTPTAVIAGVGVFLAALILLTRPMGLTWQGAVTAALTVFTIAFWATNALPPYLTAIIFMWLAVLLNAAPPELAFSGFASSAFWLVFGGLIIGAAIAHTGLADRLARMVAGRLGGSYPALIVGLVAMGIVLAFLMPSSMGRVVVIAPVLLALVDGFGLERGSNAGLGILLAGLLGVYLPSFAILSANVPNLVLAGAAESVHGYTVTYSTYLLLHLPVVGLLKAVAIVGVVIAMFPAELKAPPEGAQARTPLTPAEGRLLGLLVAALGLWLTDALHGVSPAWVATGVGVLLVLPGIGVLPMEKLRTEVNFALLFFVAGIIGLGNVIAASELSGILARGVTSVLPFTPGADFLNFVVFTATAAGLSMVGTIPTVPALITPLAAELSAATGFSLPAILLLQTVGFSLVVFPYQAPPLVVGLLLTDMPFGVLLRVLAIIALITAVVLVPLDYLWWSLLGWV